MSSFSPLSDTHPAPRSRRVERVRHELMRRELTVTRVEALSPGFIAVTLTGETLSSFVSLSFDDHVKFMIEQGAVAERRDFTPRQLDLAQRTLTLEFALHAHGPACEWARRAQVGDRALIGGPRGSMIIPADLDWHLLVGDASALPAIHRRLEELPAGTPVHAIIHVNHPQDQRAIESAADLTLQWVHSDAGLLDAVAAWQPPAGEGFAWAAGEAAVMAKVRDSVVNTHRVPLEATRISAYWKRGAADFHDTL